MRKPLQINMKNTNYVTGEKVKDMTRSFPERKSK